MSHDSEVLNRIIERDPRYRPAAYEFVFESLDFTRKRLAKQRGEPVRHISGGELAEGLRLLAQEQYGLMAKTVLNQWGVTSTSDIGNIVYNLIDAGFMDKSERDSRSDFDNVYDFDEAFSREFKIELDELEA